jgi:hypothetical protein
MDEMKKCFIDSKRRLWIPGATLLGGSLIFGYFRRNYL